jgi:hypothetical protein
MSLTPLEQEYGEATPALHVLPSRELETRPCKTVGCTGEAEASRGPYALLCARCARKAKAARATAVGANVGKHTAKVKALLPLAKRLDKALSRYTPAREELREAMEAWAAAVEELTV